MDIALTSLIISIVVSGAVVGSFILNWHNHSKNRSEEYSKMLLSIMDNFQKIDHELFYSPDYDALVVHTQKMANYADSICHLINSKKMDKKTGDFFNDFIWSAYESVKELIQMKQLKEVKIESYSELTKWYLENKPPADYNTESYVQRWLQLNKKQKTLQKDNK